MSYRLGVDVGGTFTDLVLVSPDGVARTCKVLSTTAMGGTTAKASIIEGYEIKRTGEFEIGGTMSQDSRLNKVPDPSC